MCCVSWIYFLLIAPSIMLIIQMGWIWTILLHVEVCVHRTVHWVCCVGKCCVGRVTIWRLHMEIKMWGNCTGSLRSNVRSCRLFLNEAARRLRKDHILCLDLHVTEVFTHVCERRQLRVIASRRASVVSRSSQDVLNKLLNRDFKEYLYRNKNRQRYPARN